MLPPFVFCEIVTTFFPFGLHHNFLCTPFRLLQSDCPIIHCVFLHQMHLAACFLALAHLYDDDDGADDADGTVFFALASAHLYAADGSVMLMLMVLKAVLMMLMAHCQ